MSSASRQSSEKKNKLATADSRERQRTDIILELSGRAPSLLAAARYVGCAPVIAGTQSLPLSEGRTGWASALPTCGLRPDLLGLGCWPRLKTSAGQTEAARWRTGTSPC